MTLEEYMRELILMDKQYGQEEELYPLINMLLRENDNVKHLSVRDVHNHAGSQVRHKMLYGYASFPELAILDENYAITCSDMSQIIRSYFNAKTGENHHKDTIIKSIKEDEIIIKSRIITELSDLMYGCVEVKGENSKDVIKEIIPKIRDIQKPFIFSLDKDKDEFHISTQNEISLPCGQFVGELLWYGKVLYTDGLVWKYFEITKEEREDKRKVLLEQCVINDVINDKKLAEVIKRPFEFKCMCAGIGDFSIAYQALKDYKLEVMKKKFYLHDKDIYKWEQEWDRLKYNLACINWQGENTYNQFITKEDIAKNENS